MSFLGNRPESILFQSSLSPRVVLGLSMFPIVFRQQIGLRIVLRLSLKDLGKVLGLSEDSLRGVLSSMGLSWDYCFGKDLGTSQEFQYSRNSLGTVVGMVAVSHFRRRKNVLGQSRRTHSPSPIHWDYLRTVQGKVFKGRHISGGQHVRFFEMG